jgi:hypothetical protein
MRDQLHREIVRIEDSIAREVGERDFRRRDQNSSLSDASRASLNRSLSNFGN